jgi:hypothetical protein
MLRWLRRLFARVLLWAGLAAGNGPACNPWTDAQYGEVTEEDIREILG